MAEELTKDVKGAKKWKVEVDSAVKRQKDFWNSGGRVIRRFLDDRKDENYRSIEVENQFRLNLFHANVTTQLAMMYGRIPQTDVARRWADPNDDIARVASALLQRLLNLTIQAPGSTDSDLLRACLQDRLLPGLGVARVRYSFEKEVTEERVQMTDPETGVTSIGMQQNETVVDEKAPLVYVHWRDFLWGYGRIWADVTWVGFKTYLTKEEFIERFGDKKVEYVTFNKIPIGTKEEEYADDKDQPWMKTEVIEIWDKESRQVYWYHQDCPDYLDVRDDPLGLKGFFPCPEPMSANCTTTLYLPRSDFKIAQDLYNSIDLLQTRISIITRAVKVVGLYDASNGDIKRMLQEGTDNDLIPVDNWAMFAEKQGLKGQIDWLPLSDIVEALAKLQELRSEQIQLLYEVTGMSDILRGSSDQYAGVGQEQLKAKFASVRIQHLQDDFARFASDLMQIRAEIICNHFEPESIYEQASAMYMMDSFEVVQQAIQLLKGNEMNWMWQISIKPESIAMVDYAQLKAERVEYLTAIGTFVNAVEAIGAKEPEMLPFLMELMRWGLAGFKGSQQIEGILDHGIDQVKQRLANPQPQQPPIELQEIQAKHQAEMEKQAKKAQDDMMKLLNQHKAKLIEIAADTESHESAERIQAYFNILETEAKMRADIQVQKAKGGSSG